MAVKLKEALKMMNEKVGSQKVPFHIVFFTKSGERKELFNATTRGLPAHLRSNKNFIGVRAGLKVDKHNYPVHQKLITQFNKEEVVY